MQYRVGIVSDTHNLLREEVIQLLNTCDYIIHAGDFCQEMIYDRLTLIAPVYAVRGNNDKGKWANQLDYDLRFKIGSYYFYMCHKKEEIKTVPEKTDFVVYGHSHQYQCIEKENRVFLNPGSCGTKRFSLPITMVLLKIDEDTYHIEKINLSS